MSFSQTYYFKSEKSFVILTRLLGLKINPGNLESKTKQNKTKQNKTKQNKTKQKQKQKQKQNKTKQKIQVLLLWRHIVIVPSENIAKNTKSMILSAEWNICLL